VRATLAAFLAVLVLAIAGAPHVHAGTPERTECVACVTTTAGAVAPPSVDVAPLLVLVTEVELAPGLSPVTGAPLGAIPGQSPPSAA
jgi:hypothetical protein